MSNFNQCVNRPSAEMVWWAIIVSSFIYALFLTLMLKWSGASTLVGGFKTGALFGVLLSAMNNLSMYSMTTMFNSLGALVVDVVVATLVAAVIGGDCVAVGKRKSFVRALPGWLKKIVKAMNHARMVYRFSLSG